MSLLASASKFVFPFGSTLRISSWFFSYVLELVMH